MTPSHAPLRIFVADDSRLIRSRVASMLAAPAMDIVGEAGTPRACIDGILATHPDVVVLDVQLDGGTGLEVLRAVHRVDASIAFVVFSNNSQAAYRKRYLGEGAVAFLDKAADFHELRSAVAGVRHACQ